MSNDCTSGMPADIIVASWREKMAISAAVTLPCLRNRLLCLRTRVGTTPWRRSSERTAASLVETTLPLTFLPARSVPSHVNGVVVVAVAVAILQGLRKETGVRDRSVGRASRLVNCNAIDLFQTRKAVLDFLEARLSKIGDAFLLGLRRNLHRIAAFHDDAADRFRAGHNLVDTDTALVARSALAAAFGVENREAPFDVCLREALLEQRLGGDVDGLLAIGAEPARQPLGNDQAHRARDGVWLDAHVDETRQSLGGVVRVQRRQHQVAGLRCLDRDLGRLEVADFADH